MNDLPGERVMGLKYGLEPNGSLRRTVGHRVLRLLVSVRSCDEAAAAIEGGADILDIKEPSRGSLGMADVARMQAIAELAARTRPAIPVSAALGEVSDWSGRDDLPRLPEALTFAKLGLSGLGRSTDWRDEWLRVRGQFEQYRLRRIAWVAVAYSDEQGAQSPPMDEVVSAALETDCAGLLIDTFAKDGRTLMDYIDAANLRRLADRCHSGGLLFALAGSLGENSLRDLIDVDADVIAIRTAGCENAQRDGRICSRNVAAFRNALSQIVASRDTVATCFLTPDS